MLAHQGLLPSRSLQGKDGLLEHIRRVNCVQFDPIDVAGRNHELALGARVKDFTVPMLYETLYNDRRLLDGFDKNMCIYPTEDWPYFQRNRDSARRSLEAKSHPVLNAAPEVRREIERRGPLSSSELEMEDAVRWPWGRTRLARAALEGMYFWGELVVYGKAGVRKTYDLAERHIPRRLLDAPEPNPVDDEYHDWHLHRRIGSVGLLANRGIDAWLGIQGTSRAKRTESIARLLAKGDLRQVNVDGISYSMYMRAQDEPMLKAILGRESEDLTTAPQATLIAPLDNLLWDRRLVSELFDFHYTWEVYVPAGKRRYGYYVLPVLYGDRFIARCEPVRDRKAKRLVVRNWWWEAGVDPNDKAMQAAIASCLDQFRSFLGCDSLRIDGGGSAAATLTQLML